MSRTTPTTHDIEPWYKQGWPWLLLAALAAVHLLVFRVNDMFLVGALGAVLGHGTPLGAAAGVVSVPSSAASAAVVRKRLIPRAPTRPKRREYANSSRRRQWLRPLI